MLTAHRNAHASGNHPGRCLPIPACDPTEPEHYLLQACAHVVDRMYVSWAEPRHGGIVHGEEYPREFYMLDPGDVGVGEVPYLGEVFSSACIRCTVVDRLE